MADTPAKTNITDTPGDGTTVTTLVSTHDRGSLQWNTRLGGGDPFGPEPAPTPPVAATGATAGTPGTWTPAGATPPATNQTLGGITASPTTPCTTVQYVACADNSHAYWNGTAWAVGQAA